MYAYLCYHTLLEHLDIVTPFFTKGGPWYGNILIKAIFGNLSSKMRKYMNINEASALASLQRLREIQAKLSTAWQESPYLVGNQFSRADLAVASLFAPLARPEGYGLNFPGHYPEPLESILGEFEIVIDWVTSIYAQHR